MMAPDWYSRHVSRETIAKLADYGDLLTKWTKRINLVSPSTIRDLEDRHIWDSAQIYGGQTGHWVDLGSGGGLPGIVAAILRSGEGDHSPFTLIESDQRKATFLRTCARELSLPVTVLAQRIDDVPTQNADILSARALAPLPDLLHMAENHITTDGTCIFMKGASWRDEISKAEQNWRFSWSSEPSKTNAEAAVLTIKDIQRV